jgi:hypothetical protein
LWFGPQPDQNRRRDNPGCYQKDKPT